MSESSPRSLTQRTLSGLLWTFGGAGANGIAQLVILSILARFLSPGEYGVVDAAMTVVTFSAIFSQLGVGPAVVQRPDLQTEHIRTASTLSFLFGLGIAGAVCLGAGAIGDFFHRDDVQPVLYALSAVFVMQGISVVSESLLQREMRFRELSLIDVGSYAFGYGCVGIPAAAYGFGPWSLVAGQLAQTLVRTIALLWRKPHALRPHFDRKTAGDLIGFGFGFTIARLANQTATNGDNFVVGRVLGSEALGGYARAYNLLVMPATLFGGVVNKVLFPAMAQIQSNPERLTSVYRRCLSVVAMSAMPTGVVLMILAPEFIDFLLGPKWQPVVPPFRILAAGLLFRTSYKISDTLARATGAVYRRAWRQGLYAAAVLFGAWYGSKYGTTGVAYGVLAAITLNFVCMADLSLRMTKMRWGEFVRAHGSGAALSILGFAVCYPLAQLCRSVSMPTIAVLAIAGGATALAAAIACRVASPIFLGEDGKWMLSLLFKRGKKPTAIEA